MGHRRLQLGATPLLVALLVLAGLATLSTLSDDREADPVDQPASDPTARLLPEAGSIAALEPAVGPQPSPRVARPGTAAKASLLSEQPPVSFHGRVADAETNLAVAGASVRIGSEVVTTDANGLYSGEALVGQEMVLAVRAAGYVSCRWSFVLRERRPTRRDIALERGRPLPIEVFDAESGEVIPDVEVHDPVSFLLREESSLSAPLARTGDDGTATLGVLHDTTQALLFVAPDYCITHWSWRDRPTLPGTERARVPMVRPVQIDVTTTDPAGRPLEGCALEVRQGPWDFQITGDYRAPLDLRGSVVFERQLEGRVPPENRTDALGRTTLTVPPNPVPIQVSAHLVGFDSVTSSPFSRAEAGARIPVLLALAEQVTVQAPPVATASRAPGTASISGRVTDERGAPLGQVEVRATSEVDRKRSSSATSDPAGRYSIAVAEAATYSITAVHRSVPASASGIEPGATDVDLVLADPGQLLVRFERADTGAPVVPVGGRGNGFLWRRPKAQSYRFVDHVAAVRPDHAGTYLIEYPVVGRVDLAFDYHREGWLFSEVHDVVLSSQAPTEPVVVALERGFGVEIVLDEPLEVGSDSRRTFVLLEAARASEVLPSTFDHTLRRRVVGFYGAYGHLQGRVPAGAYALRSVPDDISFRPAVFEVSADTSMPIPIAWEAR